MSFTIRSFFLITIFSLALAGCSTDESASPKTTGKKSDAVEAVKSGTGKAAEKVSKGMQTAGEATGNALQKAGQASQDAGQATGEAVRGDKK
jgi:hypothetical protein